MYRIEIKDGGRYGNVRCEARYCFTKRALKKAINWIKEEKCEFEIYKFVHLCDGMFCWSDADAYYDYEKMKKSREPAS